jgi:hypothetical protein
LACEQPAGFVDNASDCDDNNPYINPIAEEVCNGIDDNCDGLIDDDDPNVVDQQIWYGDYDHDGYGDIEFQIMGCEQPDGYVDNYLDCDDSNSDINPGVDEICNGIDDNCDGLIDDDDPNVVGQSYWYADSDGDGYGDMNDFVLACDQPEDYVDNLDDCDDSAVSVYPNAPEIYDGLDNDCDDEVDEDHDISVVIDEQDTELYANASGSHPPFSFLWSTGETNQSITKVAGEISVIASDDYGYSALDTILITNIQSFIDNSISLYPVPSKGILYFEINEPVKTTCFIEVKNNTGKTVWQTRIASGKNPVRIDLSDKDIQSGYYVLQFHNNSKIVTTVFLLLKE